MLLGGGVNNKLLDDFVDVGAQIGGVEAGELHQLGLLLELMVAAAVTGGRWHWLKIGEI